MFALLMSDELERMCKEAVVAFFELLPQIAYEQTKDNHKLSATIVIPF
jgi:hypothetical protein